MQISKNNEIFCRIFDESLKTNPINVKSFLHRLILRTHQEEDTLSLISIFSDSIATKHLPFIQPPNGWNDKENKKWSEQDYNDRVEIQNNTRFLGKSCVFNIILLSSFSKDLKDRCIGTTGYVTIDGNVGFLGIIMDPNYTKMGYATEALYTSINFAFERLGINKIIMQTDEKNNEMRGWCENTAGLNVNNININYEINGFKFNQYEYMFTIEEWNNNIKKKLEEKMNFNYNKKN